MGDWQERANKRRDERHTKSPDDGTKPSASSRKDTKRWCGGKAGREHRPVGGLYRNTSGCYELVCADCGRRLDWWFKMGQTTEPPEWVKAVQRGE